MKYTSFLSSLVLAASLALSSLPTDAFAKSRSSFGGGSKSSSFGGGSKSSSFGGSKSSGSSWGGSKATKTDTGSTTKSGWGSSKTAASPTSTGTDAGKAVPQAKTSFWGSNKKTAVAAGAGAAAVSSTDAKIAEKSALTSKASKEASSRAAIAEKFKKDNATKYATTFKTEPTRRPDYIPQHQTDSYGAYRPVYYDRSYGGYGYWNALGAFVLYDALTDRAHSYAATQPVHVHTGRSSSGGSGAAVTVILLILIVGGCAVGYYLYKR